MTIDMTAMADNAQVAADFLKCLANPNRLMICCALLKGETAVSELNQQIPLSQSALSQHLSVLRDASLVVTRRESQTIYYRLSDDRARMILEPLHRLFCQQ